MPWSAGTFSRANGATGWQDDQAANIGIEAGRHDTQDNDFRNGINETINKTGQNTPTANLPMGGFKHTGVANAAASSEYAAYGQVQAGVNVQSTALDWTATQYSNDTTAAKFVLQKSRGATTGSNVIVNNGDAIGSLEFRGNNGTTFTNLASIAAAVDGAPGATNDMPGRIVFSTTGDGSGSPTERMRINNSGEVLIDATASNGTAYKLQVGDGTGAKLVSIGGGSTSTGDGSAVVFFNGAGTSGQIGNYSAIQGGAYDGRFTIKNSGAAFVVVGITAAVGTHFMKWSNITGAWTYDTSSARYKDNIEDSSYGLAEVLAMRPVTFTYKAEPERHDVGFIAEEMVNVIPEVVAKTAEGEPDAISYDRLSSVLCKAIQELNAKVEALEARIAVLEA